MHRPLELFSMRKDYLHEAAPQLYVISPLEPIDSQIQLPRDF